MLLELFFFSNAISAEHKIFESLTTQVKNLPTHSKGQKKNYELYKLRI